MQRYVDTWIRGTLPHPYEAPNEAVPEGTRRGEEGQTLCRTAREQGGGPLADRTGARPSSREAPGWCIGVVDEREGHCCLPRKGEAEGGEPM